MYRAEKQLRPLLCGYVKRQSDFWTPMNHLGKWGHRYHYCRNGDYNRHYRDSEVEKFHHAPTNLEIVRWLTL
jgi:hypothetical protein